MLAELADPLKRALAHGHQLTIRPHVTDYALDIDIGTSVLGGEESLGGEEIRALESAPYSAAKHGGGNMRDLPLRRAAADRARLDPRGHPAEPRPRSDDPATRRLR